MFWFIFDCLIPLFINSLSNLAILSSNVIYYLFFSTSSTSNETLSIPYYLTNFSSLNTYLFYFFTCNTTILIPILSTIRFFVFSYDVIHSLGIYSFGIKIDAIPGRFNFASTIRTLLKGASYGYCFELCGPGHSSTLIALKALNV